MHLKFLKGRVSLRIIFFFIGSVGYNVWWENWQNGSFGLFLGGMVRIMATDPFHIFLHHILCQKGPMNNVLRHPPFNTLLMPTEYSKQPPYNPLLVQECGQDLFTASSDVQGYL